MADLYSAIGQNYLTKAGNGLGPKTTIVLVEKEDASALTQANLAAFIRAVTMQGGAAGTAGLDAYTVAGISAFTAGETTGVYVALQGTAAFSTDANDAYGVTGVKATVVTTFNQIPA